MKKANNLIRKEILDLRPYIPGKPIEEIKQELGLNEPLLSLTFSFITSLKEFKKHLKKRLE